MLLTKIFRSLYPGKYSVSVDRDRGTKNKKRLSGMTLIEVTVGMVVIIIVTLIAYMGVSAGANFTARGTDLRNADGKAVGVLEDKLSEEEPAVTEVTIKYQVDQIYVTGEGDAAVSGVVEQVPSKEINVGLIEGTAEENDVVVQYDMYKYLPDKN